MKLPPPREKLAGCMWLARIIAKARLICRGELPTEYAERFCHPSGVDGQFITFFKLTKEHIVEASQADDDSIIIWFLSLPEMGRSTIDQWNHIAINLGRPGFPMADRLPVALATSYKHLAHQNHDTVFAVLEADEAGDPV